MFWCNFSTVRVIEQSIAFLRRAYEYQYMYESSISNQDDGTYVLRMCTSLHSMCICSYRSSHCVLSHTNCWFITNLCIMHDLSWNTRRFSDMLSDACTRAIVMSSVKCRQILLCAWHQPTLWSYNNGDMLSFYLNWNKNAADIVINFKVHRSIQFMHDHEDYWTTQQSVRNQSIWVVNELPLENTCWSMHGLKGVPLAWQLQWGLVNGSNCSIP